MENLDSAKKDKNNNKIKYILCFLIFFVIGAVIGVFATKNILDDKENENDEEIVVEEKVLDITEDANYTDLVSQLYGYLGNNSVFYASTGLDMNNLENVEKLKLVYNYIITNKLDQAATLNQWWAGSTACENNFVVDTTTGADGSVVNGTTCTVSKFTTTLVNDTYKKLYGDTEIQTNESFNPNNFKSCVLAGSEYICGNVSNVSGVTGVLEPKFEIVKVTKDDNSIIIYDKGYLLDTRSNVVNLNDGNGNHYLHSADSTEYYYELKSSDNLTFAHTFRLAEDGSYYYNGTKVVES